MTGMTCMLQLQLESVLYSVAPSSTAHLTEWQPVWHWPHYCGFRLQKRLAHDSHLWSSDDASQEALTGDEQL